MKKQMINTLKFAAVRLRDEHKKDVKLKSVAPSYLLTVDGYEFVLMNLDESMVSIAIQEVLWAKFALGDEELCGICIADSIKNYIYTKSVDSRNHED